MSLKQSAQRIKEVLENRGYTNEIVELPESTRTAVEAAKAIGCEVAQIAKSIIFLRVDFGTPLLVVTSGINRVNEKKVSEWLQEPLGKANANFVRERTGFVIGGVPPIAHTTPIRTLIDEDLFQYAEIWAAAGHPKAVFRLTPEELIQMTEGEVISLK